MVAQQSIIKQTCATLGLDLDMSLHPGQCSGGMLQQAALVRALCQSPAGILADEPFSALDIAVAGRVRSGFMRAVKALGSCAVIVLHDLEDILEICDSVLMIPGRPFTSETDRRGFATLERIDNRARRTMSKGPGEHPSLVEILRQVLRAEAQK